jgi:hypothetical protein
VLSKTFTGDGSTRDFFQFEGPFIGKPTVTLDAAPQTVGYFGFDLSGFDFYIDKEGWGLHRYPAQSAPANGASIVMLYSVRFQNYTMEEDTAEIAARAAIQNDSGVIEGLSEDRYIDSPAGLTARATGLLRQFGEIPITIDFETNTVIESTSNSLVPGMQMAVNLTDGPSDVNDSFLVETVESQWQAAAPSDIWMHRVKLTTLEPYGMRSTPLERLAEQVRIGPDIGTIVSESPEAPAGTIYIDARTITANTTIGVPTTVADGGEIEFQLTQDGTGGWVVSWNAVFKGVGALSAGRTANLLSILRFRRLASNYYRLFANGDIS